MDYYSKQEAHNIEDYVRLPIIDFSGCVVAAPTVCFISLYTLAINDGGCAGGTQEIGMEGMIIMRFSGVSGRRFRSRAF